MGVSRDGKLATVTNIRLPYQEKRKTTARSRGVCSPATLAACLVVLIMHIITRQVC